MRFLLVKPEQVPKLMEGNRLLTLCLLEVEGALNPEAPEVEEDPLEAPDPVHLVNPLPKWQVLQLGGNTMKRKICP